MRNFILMALLALTLASCGKRTILANTSEEDGEIHRLGEPVKWVIRGTDVYIRHHYYYGDELELCPTATFNPFINAVTYNGITYTEE